MFELVTAEQYELAQIDANASYETAWQDADKILESGLIVSGAPNMFNQIKNIYFELIATINSIPSVEEMVVEVDTYNCTVMDRAVDIIYRYRKEEFENPHEEYSSAEYEEDMEEDIRSQIMETLSYSNSRCWATEDDIFEALSFLKLAFIISHEDRIYRENPILAMDDAIDVLANDCQVILVPQFSIGWGINSDPAFVHSRIVTNTRREALLCQQIS